MLACPCQHLTSLLWRVQLNLPLWRGWRCVTVSAPPASTSLTSHLERHECILNNLYMDKFQEFLSSYANKWYDSAGQLLIWLCTSKRWTTKYLDRWKQREWVQSPHVLERERERERDREWERGRQRHRQREGEREGDRGRERFITLGFWHHLGCLPWTRWRPVKIWQTCCDIN